MVVSKLGDDRIPSGNGRGEETVDGETLGRLLAETAELISDVRIICGIPSFNNAHTIGNVVRAVEAGLRRSFPDVPAAIVVSDGGSQDGTLDEATAATTRGDEELLLIGKDAPSPKRLTIRYRGISGKGSAFRTIFTLAKLTGAGAVAVFD